MNKILIISVLEAVYTIYMLNYFETRYSLAHPFSYFRSRYFYHPIGVSEEPMSQICSFGHQMSWYLGAYFIIRVLLLMYVPRLNKSIKLFNRALMILVFIVSLVNFNALVYLMPIFIVEYNYF